MPPPPIPDEIPKRLSIRSVSDHQREHLARARAIRRRKLENRDRLHQDTRNQIAALATRLHELESAMETDRDEGETDESTKHGVKRPKEDDMDADEEQQEYERERRGRRQEDEWSRERRANGQTPAPNPNGSAYRPNTDDAVNVDDGSMWRGLKTAAWAAAFVATLAGGTYIAKYGNEGLQEMLRANGFPTGDEITGRRGPL